MDNRLVAHALLAMARALEYLDENPFKVSAYRKAADAVMLLEQDISELVARGGLGEVPGIGRTISARIAAWVRDRDFSDLQEVQAKLPEGFDELLKVPGLGFKRIRLLQQERGVTTLESLLDAVREGRLSGLRAFPRKFVEELPGSIERVMGYRGRTTLDLGLAHAHDLRERIAGLGLQVELTGQCRRTREIIDRIELLVGAGPDAAGKILEALGETGAEPGEGLLAIPSRSGRPAVEVLFARQEDWPVRLLLTTGSEEHVHALREEASRLGFELRNDGVYRNGTRVHVADEKDIYGLLGMAELPPEVREGRPLEISLAAARGVPDLISGPGIRGTIHNHSIASDGRATIPQMAAAAQARGYEWIGISDHSQTASYAGGLSPDAVLRQQAEINELNRSPGGVFILKGIESDILMDGSLDYPPEILETFDFVVASIHMGFEMDRKAMTRRIIRALRNPFTSILGHPTGRLILAREPYAVDMEAVLEEAVENGVAVELNANPQRLDLDWRLIEPFIARGGIIALSPDAHTTDGLDDMAYGIMIARKGFLTPRSCLNAWGVEEVRRLLRKA